VNGHEFASRLRETYAEIDRLNGIVREYERDMNGTLATLERERNRELNARIDAMMKAGEA
jgi:hypothetical protein